MRIENESLAKYASLEQDTPQVSNVRWKQSWAMKIKNIKL